ncbi:hypothetical protein [Oceanicaulis sp.]|uniref:hypothetical protein n=1 Tax=Oceanicaulis sp. TaxID=1924941 RepID=UPI003BA9743E
MKRLLFIALGVIIAIVLILGGAFGAFIWKFTPKIPDAAYSEPADETEARLQDLDYLRRMPEADKSFSPAERVAFNALIDDLERRAETMSHAEFVMGVSAAGAVTENGHSGVSMRRTMNLLNSLPVRFAWFGDGLHIVRARAEYAPLIGSRVNLYDGQTPETLYPQMDPYFGGNDSFLRQNTASFFAAPASLHAAGLIDQPDHVTLELVSLQGETFTQALVVEDQATGFMGVQRNALARPFEVEQDSGHDWRFLDPARTEATWFGRHPEQVLWADTLDHGGVYWRMRNVFGNDDTPLPDWLETQAESLRDAPANYLVLDLRANEGGDYTRAMSVARNIGELVQADGHVYVLTDGDTFSAGIVTAYYALYGAGERAVLVGSPMGDDMQFWAEGGGTPMRLPNSDIAIYVSTGYHDWENGCSDWSRCFWINTLFGVALGPVDVALEAPLLFADYARGVDSGMEAILAIEAERASTP